jgi:hypothetical protein
MQSLFSCGASVCNQTLEIANTAQRLSTRVAQASRNAVDADVNTALHFFIQIM